MNNILFKLCYVPISQSLFNEIIFFLHNEYADACEIDMHAWDRIGSLLLSMEKFEALAYDCNSYNHAASSNLGAQNGVQL